MTDRAVKQTAVKGGASTVDMAARPFQCEWHEGCSKSFNRKSDLQRHYRIHTNERPYACDYKPCNKTFIQRSALTVHRRTHTGDKPHKCPYLGCGKCFSDSSSLARHRRIHTNDKPYICRNQRCKKAFCRKTTMTKHIRKEHPAEPIQDDQDAEYSDVDPSEEEGPEEDVDEIKEETRYPDAIDTKVSQLTHPVGNYNRDLWRLPSETTQRPTPLQLRPVPLTEIVTRDIKLERTSSAASQRSMNSPYADGPMSSDLSLVSANAGIGNIPMHAMTNGALSQHYQLRNPDSSVSLWSPQPSMQESPISATNSSPSSASTQSHGVFTSQPFQIPPTSLPSNERIPYPLHHDSIVLPIQQPMSDLAVHEIHLDQPQSEQYRDMASTPVHQQPFDSIPQHVAQEQYINMSRESSRHHSYSDSQPQSAIPQYHGELPTTPAANQSLPYSIQQQPPYQQPQFVPMDNYNSYYPPNSAILQYPNDETMDWLEEIKPEDTWGQPPSQRIPGWL